MNFSNGKITFLSLPLYWEENFHINPEEDIYGEYYDVCFQKQVPPGVYPVNVIWSTLKQKDVKAIQIKISDKKTERYIYAIEDGLISSPEDFKKWVNKYRSGARFVNNTTTGIVGVQNNEISKNNTPFVMSKDYSPESIDNKRVVVDKLDEKDAENTLMVSFAQIQQPIMGAFLGAIQDAITYACWGMDSEGNITELLIINDIFDYVD